MSPETFVLVVPEYIPPLVLLYDAKIVNSVFWSLLKAKYGFESGPFEQVNEYIPFCGVFVVNVTEFPITFALVGGNV